MKRRSLHGASTNDIAPYIGCNAIRRNRLGESDHSRFCTRTNQLRCGAPYA